MAEPYKNGGPRRRHRIFLMGSLVAAPMLFAVGFGLMWRFATCAMPEEMGGESVLASREPAGEIEDIGDVYAEPPPPPPPQEAVQPAPPVVVERGFPSVAAKRIERSVRHEGVESFRRTPTIAARGESPKELPEEELPMGVSPPAAEPPGSRAEAGATAIPGSGYATALTWNGWAEEPRLITKQPRHEPLAALKTEKDYRFFIDLAAIAYQRAGITESPVQPGLEEELRKLAQEIEEGTLQIVILVDPRYYELDGDREQKVDLDLTLLRNPLPPLPAGDTLKDMTKTRLGRATFDVTTRKAEGVGTIDVSIWSANEPVDEFVISRCVGLAEDDPRCKEGVGVFSNGFGGVDSLRLASDTGSLPDAGLHLIEIDDHELRGVLKLNGEKHPHVWKADRSIEDLRHELGLGVEAADHQIIYPDSERLQANGLTLFRGLFPDTDGDARAAGEALAKFLIQQQDDTVSPASLFARVATRGSGQALFLPLGLLALPQAVELAQREPVPIPEPVAPVDHPPATDEVLGGEQPSEQSDVSATVRLAASDPIGMFARVEMPLPSQSYGSSGTCIKRWVIAQPDESHADKPLKLALGAMGRLNSITVAAENRLSSAADLRKFWEPGSMKTAEPSMYVVTSHHADDRLRFWTGNELFAAEVGADLAAPTVVVLNGCNTAGPKTTDFIRILNERGADAIIATSTTLPGIVAGHYLDCLAGSIMRAQDQRITVREAHRQALECLAESEDDDHRKVGSRIATYQFLGNGSIELCPSFASVVQ